MKKSGPILGPLLTRALETADETNMFNIGHLIDIPEFGIIKASPDKEKVMLLSKTFDFIKRVPTPCAPALLRQFFLFDFFGVVFFPLTKNRTSMSNEHVPGVSCFEPLLFCFDKNNVSVRAAVTPVISITRSMKDLLEQIHYEVCVFLPKQFSEFAGVVQVGTIAAENACHNFFLPAYVRDLNVTSMRCHGVIKKCLPYIDYTIFYIKLQDCDVVLYITYF